MKQALSDDRVRRRIPNTMSRTDGATEASRGAAAGRRTRWARGGADLPTLEARLVLLLAAGLEALERRIAEGGLDERSARMLTELCRGVELAGRRSKGAGVERPGGGTSDDGTEHTDDPAWLRAELKRRVHRIRADAGRRSGDRGGAD
jgi:hypothetical protein